MIRSWDKSTPSENSNRNPLMSSLKKVWYFNWASELLGVDRKFLKSFCVFSKMSSVKDIEYVTFWLWEDGERDLKIYQIFVDTWVVNCCKKVLLVPSRNWSSLGDRTKTPLIGDERCWLYLKAQTDISWMVRTDDWHYSTKEPLSSLWWSVHQATPFICRMSIAAMPIKSL